MPEVMEVVAKMVVVTDRGGTNIKIAAGVKMVKVGDQCTNG